MNHSQELGRLPIPQLLFKQALPAAIGILTLSIYNIVDTIFVGQYIGSVGISAITVVMPITFLIASLGMAVGVGGGSIISRALGGDNLARANKTFGNQAGLTLVFCSVFMFVGIFLEEPILKLFGATEKVMPYAQTYFRILIAGVPFLGWAMMSNNIIRAEGNPKVAMFIMIVAAIINTVLDPIFIIVLEMGIAGAAWATLLSYIFAAAYTVHYFFSGKSDLTLYVDNLWLDMEIVGEIFSIGFVSFARQGSISVLAIVMNNSLVFYGGDMALSVYGIINRMMMFINFPIFGVVQGFLPIAGFNYGAKQWARVRQVIYTAIQYGTLLAFCIFGLIYFFAEPISAIFTTEAEVIKQTAPAMVVVFWAMPLITIQMIGASYYQAIGKGIPALLLTLTKQLFCLVPLVLLLPMYMGLDGIWYAFPVADVLSTLITFIFLQRALGDLQSRALKDKELSPAIEETIDA